MHRDETVLAVGLSTFSNPCDPKLRGGYSIGLRVSLCAGRTFSKLQRGVFG
jgi:hypothetical protein